MKNNETINLEIANATFEVSALADRLQLLLFDFLGRYFDTVEPDENYEYQYEIMQAHLNSICDLAYDIHKGLDKLQGIEEEGEL